MADLSKLLVDCADDLLGIASLGIASFGVADAGRVSCWPWGTDSGKSAVPVNWRLMVLSAVSDCCTWLLSLSLAWRLSLTKLSWIEWWLLSFMWFPSDIIANQKLAKLKAQRYCKIFSILSLNIKRMFFARMHIGNDLQLFFTKWLDKFANTFNRFDGSKAFGDKVI